MATSTINFIPNLYFLVPHDVQHITISQCHSQKRAEKQKIQQPIKFICFYMHFFMRLPTLLFHDSFANSCPSNWIWGKKCIIQYFKLQFDFLFSMHKQICFFVPKKRNLNKRYIYFRCVCWGGENWAHVSSFHSYSDFTSGEKNLNSKRNAYKDMRQSCYANLKDLAGIESFICFFLCHLRLDV